MENNTDKLIRSIDALQHFIERIEEDRYVLTVVLPGGRSAKTI